MLYMSEDFDYRVSKMFTYSGPSGGVQADCFETIGRFNDLVTQRGRDGRVLC